MGSNNRYNTSGAEQEPLSVCLLESVCRLVPDLSCVPIHKRILTHTAADHSWEDLLRFGQGR